jgi:hypothetical protein
MAFVPIENTDELQLDNIDRNKRNNKLENLRWITGKENMKNAAQPKIVPKLWKTINCYDGYDNLVETLDNVEITSEKYK